MAQTPTRRLPGARSPGLAAGVGAACVGLVVVGVGLAIVNADGLRDLASEFGVGTAVAAVSFATVGATVAARRPGHWVGLLLLGTGVVNALFFASARYAIYAFGPAEAPLGTAAGWLASWVWFLNLPLLVLLLLVFPTGRAPTPRWRWLGWAAAVHGLLGALLLATSPHTFAAGLPAAYRNPFAVSGVDGFFPLVQEAFVALLLLALVAVVVRFRASDRHERQQLGWFGYAAALAVAIALVGVELDATSLAFSISWPLVAVAAGLTVLRRRLYGVDVAVSRSLLGAVFLMFVTGGWLAVATFAGALVGRQRGDVLPAVIATAVVALLAQPVLRVTRRAVDQLVHGRRLDPYRALAAFASRAGGTTEPDSVLLAETARLATVALGARNVTVWLRDGAVLRAAAGHPSLPHDDEVALTDEVPTSLPDADRVAPIRHHGQLLGALSVTSRRGAEPSSRDDDLLADLAALSALVLAAQRAREELLLSRRRLVQAQTQERRRIERDLHDGAQQQLIALKVALGVARSAAERRGDGQLCTLLAELGAQVDDAVTGMRALIAGVYPQTLTTGGVGAALREATRGGRLCVRVADHLDHRYPADAEAATFFSCLEAVQNAVKHSGAQQVDVELTDTELGVLFVVRDDGRGFPADALSGDALTGDGRGLRNITDRVEALGGTLTIRSTPGQGASITGCVPATAVPGT